MTPSNFSAAPLTPYCPAKLGEGTPAHPGHPLYSPRQPLSHSHLQPGMEQI